MADQIAASHGMDDHVLEIVPGHVSHPGAVVDVSPGTPFDFGLGSMVRHCGRPSAPALRAFLAALSFLAFVWFVHLSWRRDGGRISSGISVQLCRCGGGGNCAIDATCRLLCRPG